MSAVRKIVFLACLWAAPMAHAADDWARISDRAAFLQTLAGRQLHIGFFGLSLLVTPDGQITGRALGYDVRGEWAWQDGYFCRSMTWGDEPIPYNCQLVQATETEMRFTSDKGQGRSADFRLR